MKKLKLSRTQKEFLYYANKGYRIKTSNSALSSGKSVSVGSRNYTSATFHVLYNKLELLERDHEKTKLYGRWYTTIWRLTEKGKTIASAIKESDFEKENPELLTVWVYDKYSDKIYTTVLTGKNKTWETDATHSWFGFNKYIPLDDKRIHLTRESLVKDILDRYNDRIEQSIKNTINIIAKLEEFITKHGTESSKN